MVDVLRALKPSRWFLISLIVVALLTLGGVMLGYVPTVIAPLTPSEYADFVTSVWGVVATVVGIAVAGWVTLEQLDSEREDRGKERSLSAKHAALVDGIRGLKNMIAQLSRLSNLEIDQDEIGRGFIDAHSLAAPAWAVSGLTTVRELQKLSNDVSMTFMRFGVERHGLVQKAKAHKDCEAKVRHARENCAQLRETVNESIAKFDVSNIYELKQLIRAADERLEKHEAARDDAMSQLADAHIPYMLRCIFEARRLQDQYRHFLACIRLEIHTAEEDETFDDYMDAFDLQDAAALRNLKSVVHQSYHNDIDALALSAGCAAWDVAASSIPHPTPTEQFEQESRS